jgi:diguanylate cyclase (GGDEF)-like protein
MREKDGMGMKISVSSMAGLVVATIVVCFVLITAISLYSLKTTIDRNTDNMMELITSRIYDVINDRLMSSIVTSQTMANDDFLQRQLEDGLSGQDGLKAMMGYLSMIKTNMGFDTAYVISDRSHEYITPEGLNKIVSADDEHDVWYDAFLSKGKKVDFDVDTDEVNGSRWTVFTNARMERPDGKLLGVCGVGLAMYDIQALLKRFETEYGVKVNLVDKQGIVQIDTDSINIENARLAIDMAGACDGEQRVSRRLADGSYTVTRYIDAFDWYLVVRGTGQQWQQAVYGMLLRNVLAMAAVLLLLFICVRALLSYERRKMQYLVMHDELTGLLNRKFFDYHYREHYYQALAMFDIDGFKQINDAQGHLAGDVILKSMAGILQQVIPAGNEVIRWGGDEFIILFQGEFSRAEGLCEELRQSVAREGRVTISLGLCRMGSDIIHSVKAADELLYKAKENGRNQVVSRA